MQFQTTVRRRWQAACALAASLGLVTASAGFGAVYAWQTSATHGPLLASLAVLMALSLEVAKPLAIAGMLDAVRGWEIGRAAALALLALIAISYSVTAELSLMARSRADAAAERASESRKGVDARGRVEAIRAEIARHDSILGRQAPAAPPAPTCSGEWLANAKARAACLEQSRLHGKAMEAHSRLQEQYREETAARAADRRRLIERLERAEREAGAAPTERPSDPGAKALASYLAALGLQVPPDRLADWIVLIGVLALEIGSALAGLLVAPARSPAARAPEAAIPADPSPGQAPDHSRVLEPRGGRRDADTARARVLQIITAAGGTVHGGQRALAERAGVSKTRLRQVLEGLTAEGVVRVRAGSTGTAVRMVGSAG